LPKKKGGGRGRERKGIDWEFLRGGGTDLPGSWGKHGRRRMRTHTAGRKGGKNCPKGKGG